MNLCDAKELKILLEKHGFRFSKAKGQNFLIAGWVPRNIAEKAGVDERTGVLEIGPGVGCLTAELAKRAAKVVAVELDQRLMPVLEESLAGCTNVEIVSGDILALDIPQLVEDKLGRLTPVVCANLPYNITTPVLTHLIDSRCFRTVTVMVQREVAQRICAAPGTADYGAFSVYVNYHTEPEILFSVSPDCFLPRPKIHSAVITLRARSAPPADIDDERLFFRVVRASFAQRRKTLVNGLYAVFGDRLSKAEIASLLLDCDLDAQVRGETLTIGEFAKLSNLIGEKLK